MRIFDAEQILIQDLQEEGTTILTKETDAFQVKAIRHPTLGRILIVEGPDGQGLVVEIDE